MGELKGDDPSVRGRLGLRDPSEGGAKHIHNRSGGCDEIIGLLRMISRVRGEGKVGSPEGAFV